MGLGKQVNCVDVITPFSFSFSLSKTRNTRPSFGVPDPLAVCIGLGGYEKWTNVKGASKSLMFSTFQQRGGREN